MDAIQGRSVTSKRRAAPPFLLATLGETPDAIAETLGRCVAGQRYHVACEQGDDYGDDAFCWLSARYC